MRAWVALPGTAPNIISNAEITGWKLGDPLFEEDPQTGKMVFVRAVQVSRTVGGGEQIFGKVRGFFNFFRNEPK